MQLPKIQQYRIAAWLMILSLSLPLHAFANGDDDFDDNNKDTSKWGNDIMLALGELHEQNTHLEFICDNVLSDDDTLRPWIAEKFPVNADWTVQVDVFNSTAPNLDFQVNAAGMRLISPLSAETELDHEFYASSLGFPNSGRKGFDADMEVEGVKIGDSDSGQLAGTETINGAMRIEYTGATKVAEFFYDLDITDGTYDWTFLASYGIAGSGGSTTNADWGLSDTNQLTLYLWGFSEGMTITDGQIYLDNFVETGGVPPSGGPSPVPTGNFQFGFPTDNPLLTAIASITGNYTGITPSGTGRNYDIDVAQDEQGKVISMGVVDGIENDEGGSEIPGPTGTVKTVDEKPTAQLRGSFSGATDGDPSSGSATVTALVEITDIGGGTNGIMATASGSGTQDGVPGSVSNMPVTTPTTEDMENNFSKDWTLNLVITNMTIKGKETLTASATLTQPNGDIIEFPPRKVKYQEEKGFKVSLSKGMNVSVNPPTTTKAKLAISGMTMTQMGEEWSPTGGTISYQFLGQRGIANVLDFDLED